MSVIQSQLEVEKELLRELKEGKISALLVLYNEHREDLLLFSYTHLKDCRKAITLVNIVFEELWESRFSAKIEPPVYSYLTDRTRKHLRENS